MITSVVEEYGFLPSCVPESEALCIADPEAAKVAIAPQHIWPDKTLSSPLKGYDAYHQYLETISTYPFSVRPEKKLSISPLYKTYDPDRFEKFFAKIDPLDQEVPKLQKKDPESAKRYLTDYTRSCMEKTVKMYKELRNFLITIYTNNKLGL